MRGSKLCGINLSPIKVEGETEILVQIGGKESVLSVIIADVASDMVLGNPWVKTVGAKLGEKGKPVVSSDNYEIQAFEAQWTLGEIFNGEENNQPFSQMSNIWTRY